MAKRGDIARQSVTDRIIEAFGKNYVTTQDRKIYVNAKDGTETIQFAISITMPKNPIAATPSSNVLNSESESGAKVPPPRVSISDEDREAVDRLMEKLGLER